MLQHTLPILTQAEKLAGAGAAVETVLGTLRGLSLNEFGQFMIDLPNDLYPALSAMLPSMASTKVQTDWTGSSGPVLLKQTVAFVRQLENNYARYIGKPLKQARILDFGCGYGRILRMLYYYSAPADLWGVDAWERSLDICRQDRVLGNLALSKAVPDTLPVGNTKFDLVFAFSVFTHLAPKAADACLGAIRKCTADNGILVATIRPVEFWPYIDQVRGTNHARRLSREHYRSGFAYLPHQGPEGETYGDSSIDFDYFSRPGWEMIGHDWSFEDPYQVSIVLKPV